MPRLVHPLGVPRRRHPPPKEEGPVPGSSKVRPDSDIAPAREHDNPSVTQPEVSARLEDDFSGWSKLEIALYWAGLGVPVLPLWDIIEKGGRLRCACGKPNTAKGHKPGKHPRTLHGVNDASGDLDRVRRWWEDTPDAHVGLATGHEFAGTGRYLVVLDFDSRDGLVLWERAGCTEPKTYQVRTGRRGYGRHLYFLAPVPLSSSRGDLSFLGVDNVDVRGLGGYVVAPAMLHAEGRAYEALSGCSEIAMLPSEVQRLLFPPGAGRSSKSSGRSSVTGLDPAFLERAVNAELNRLPTSDMPPMVQELLDRRPVSGKRSEAAMQAFIALARLTDDDELVAGTILASNIGERYHEAIDSRGLVAGLKYLLGEVHSARQFLESLADSGKDHRRRFVEQVAEAARIRLAPKCGTCLKILLGMLRLAADRAVPTFSASQKEIAIEAGVTAQTVAVHRTHLVDFGWIEIVREPVPLSQRSYVYRLMGQSVTPSPQSGFGPRQLAGGNEVTHGLPLSLSAREDGKPKSQRVALDVSDDGWRWGATSRLWETLQYLSYDRDTHIPELMRRTGKQRKAIHRALKRANEKGLIAGRSRGDPYRLHPDFDAHLAALARDRGTAGKKVEAKEQLALEREERRKFLAEREGELRSLEEEAGIDIEAETRQLLREVARSKSKGKRLQTPIPPTQRRSKKSARTTSSSTSTRDHEAATPGGDRQRQVIPSKRATRGPARRTGQTKSTGLSQR